MDHQSSAESTHDVAPVNDETIAIEAHWLKPFAKIAFQWGRPKGGARALYAVCVTSELGSEEEWTVPLTPAWSEDDARLRYYHYTAQMIEQGADPHRIIIATIDAGDFIRACMELTVVQVSLALNESTELVQLPRELALYLMHIADRFSDIRWQHDCPSDDFFMAAAALLAELSGRGLRPQGGQR